MNCSVMSRDHSGVAHAKPLPRGCSSCETHRSMPLGTRTGEPGWFPSQAPYFILHSSQTYPSLPITAVTLMSICSGMMSRTGVIGLYFPLMVTAIRSVNAASFH